MTNNDHPEAVAVFKQAHCAQHPRLYKEAKLKAAERLRADVLKAARSGGLTVDENDATPLISLGRAKVRMCIDPECELDPSLLLSDGNIHPLPITYDAGVDAYLGPMTTLPNGQPGRKDAVTAIAEAIVKVLRPT